MEPVILVSVAVALLAFGAISRRAERSSLTPPMWFVLVGYGLGSHGLGLIPVTPDGAAIRTLAELALILVLFTDAARIDLTCLRREESLPLRLLTVGLPLTVAGGAFAAVVIFPAFGPLEALLLAAILAPTDAALGQAVVSSRLLPVRIRQSLNVESGLNDGFVLPLVLVAASLAGAEDMTTNPWIWVRFAALQIILGPVVGIFAGFGGGRLVDWASRRDWINDPFERLSVLGIAVTAFAGAELVGGNGFIAAFVAGLTLGNSARGRCSHLYEFGEAEGQLLTLLVFLIFGSMLVPTASAWWDLRVLGYVVLSLTAIRMIPVAVSLVGTGLHVSSVMFLGWFGPRGLASILFVLLIVEENQLEAGPQLEAIVVLTVLLSTVAHGMTAYPLVRRYASRLGKGADGAGRAEHADEQELPVRIRHRNRAMTAESARPDGRVPTAVGDT